MRELRATRYQFDRPFILDSSAASEVFGPEAAVLPRPAHRRPVDPRATRHWLRILATWPWADQITAAFTRIAAVLAPG
jgi:hypothetical protein